MLRAWYHWLRSRKAALRFGAGKSPSIKLRVEQLEARDTPTVAFKPAFGAEQAIVDTSKTVLTDPPVFLIFWGSEWAATPGSGKAASDDDLAIEARARTL